MDWPGHSINFASRLQKAQVKGKWTSESSIVARDPGHLSCELTQNGSRWKKATTVKLDSAWQSFVLDVATRVHERIPLRTNNVPATSKATELQSQRMKTDSLQANPPRRDCLEHRESSDRQLHFLVVIPKDNFWTVRYIHHLFECGANAEL